MMGIIIGVFLPYFFISLGFSCKWELHNAESLALCDGG